MAVAAWVSCEVMLILSSSWLSALVGAKEMPVLLISGMGCLDTRSSLTRDVMADVRLSSLSFVWSTLLLICSIHNEIVLVSRSALVGAVAVVCDCMLLEGVEWWPGMVTSDPNSLK